MKFYELQLNLSGDGERTARIAGPSSGYFPNGNQNKIPLDRLVPEEDYIFDRLVFTGGDKIHVTDFIWHAHISGLGYVLSERIKTLLSDFNLPKHKFYKLPNYQDARGNNHQFYKLHMLQHAFDYSFIDFEKSSFYLGDFFKENKEIMRFRDENELVTRLKNLDDLEEKIWEHHIVLNDHYYKKKLDCFHIHHFTNNFIICEKLKQALQSMKATGIQFKEYNIR